MAAEEQKATEETGDCGISICVLGGCGFIGRNLVKYLMSKNLNIDKIKVCDSKLAALSFFTQELRDLYNDPKIVFKQSDLTREAHVDRAFKDEKFDYVFNCCGETRCGKDEEEYNRRNVKSAELCAAATSLMGAKWIELSEARVYKDTSKAKNEKAKIGPWTKVAKSRLVAEDTIRKTENLQYVVLRPALVYGPGDKESLTPRILCAATYKQSGETMKFLWGKSLKINCVHVRDVCKAMWLCATEAPNGSVYNLCDNSDLDQGKFNSILGEIFQINTGFFNGAINLAAKLAIGQVAGASNEKHVPGWSELCRTNNILNTPLSPYMDVEVLKKCNTAIDGTKISKDLNFEYDHPQINAELVREVIDEYVAQGLFPDILGASAEN